MEKKVSLKKKKKKKKKNKKKKKKKERKKLKCSVHKKIIKILKLL